MRAKKRVNKNEFHIDRKAFNIISIHDDDSDLEYWKNRTPHQRLKSLEMTRQILYGYGHSHSRFQRVYKVIKLTQG
jgi:hypothetical protein